MGKLIMRLQVLLVKKQLPEAKKYGDIHIVYDGSSNDFKHIPTQDELDLSKDASYLHICANNTIYGTEWKYVPETNGVPIIADMSSNILSKPVDVSKYGMIMRVLKRTWELLD